MTIETSALQAAGWTAFHADGFSGVIDPIWERGSLADLELGFVAQPGHSNGRHMGTVHGGLLMTFADIALGYKVVKTLGEPRCATAQLQLHFVAAGRTGEFVICRPEIIKRTSQLVFMRGLIAVDDKVIASADGIWKVFEPKPR